MCGGVEFCHLYFFLEGRQRNGLCRWLASLWRAILILHPHTVDIPDCGWMGGWNGKSDESDTSDKSAWSLWCMCLAAVGTWGMNEGD